MGDTVGAADGAEEGNGVVGDTDGVIVVGTAVVGDVDGSLVAGCLVGRLVGCVVG